MKTSQMNKLILLIEAVLIIITLATGGKAVIGMCCYWAVVAVYHLTDFIFGKIEDGKGK